MKRSDLKKYTKTELENRHIKNQEEEEYKDGYNGQIEEYIDEIFTNNYDEFVEEYAEMKGIN